MYCEMSSNSINNWGHHGGLGPKTCTIKIIMSLVHIQLISCQMFPVYFSTTLYTINASHKGNKSSKTSKLTTSCTSLNLILISSSCEQLLHFLCDQRYGTVGGIKSGAKNNNYKNSNNNNPAYLDWFFWIYCILDRFQNESKTLKNCLQNKILNLPC